VKQPALSISVRQEQVSVCKYIFNVMTAYKPDCLFSNFVGLKIDLGRAISIARAGVRIASQISEMADILSCC
jgi:hypothetical protein